jgi:hypothetical protein
MTRHGHKLGLAFYQMKTFGGQPGWEVLKGIDLGDPDYFHIKSIQRRESSSSFVTGELIRPSSTLLRKKTDERAIQAIRIGPSIYRLREAAAWTFKPGSHNKLGRFIVKGFEKVVVGRGRSLNSARSDWERRLHVKFQTLYALQDTVMTDAEALAWTQISRLVDIDAYWRAIPLVSREVGKVLKSSKQGKLLVWEDGREERIRFSQAPGELVRICTGQGLVALTVRDPTTYKLLRVVWVGPNRPGSASLDDGLGKKSDRIPTIRTLPETTWD